MNTIATVCVDGTVKFSKYYCDRPKDVQEYLPRGECRVAGMSHCVGMSTSLCTPCFLSSIFKPHTSKRCLLACVFAIAVKGYSSETPDERDERLAKEETAKETRDER